MRKSPLPASPQCGDGRQRVAIQRTADEIARPGRSPERFLRCGPTHGMVGHLRDVQAARERGQGEPRAGGWHGGVQRQHGPRAPKCTPSSSCARPHDLGRAGMARTHTLERMVLKSMMRPTRKALQSCHFLRSVGFRAGVQISSGRVKASVTAVPFAVAVLILACAMVSRA